MGVCVSKLTGKVSIRSANVPRHQKDLPRDSTQSRYKDDPEPSFSNNMGHESIVQILLFILDSSPSEAVLERVEVTELNVSLDLVVERETHFSKECSCRDLLISFYLNRRGYLRYQNRPIDPILLLRVLLRSRR
jgi:hypothetical protein